MAAPPLPPKGSSASWTRENRDGERQSAPTLQQHLRRTPTRVDEVAPPIPPRPVNVKSWNSRYDPLSAVPPLPGKGPLFKMQPSSMSLPSAAALPMSENARNYQMNSNTSSFQNMGFQTMNSANIITRSFIPNYNLHSFTSAPLSFCNMAYNPSSISQRYNGFDIHHSKSAPDLVTSQFSVLPNLHRSSIPNSQTMTLMTNNGFPNSNRIMTNQSNLEGVLKFMKKKRDSNLIDLYCSESDFGDIRHLGHRKSTVDDILKLFDPLFEEEPAQFTTASEVEIKNIPVEQCSMDSTIDSVETTPVKVVIKTDETPYAKLQFPPKEEDSLLKINKRVTLYDPEMNAFCEKLRQLRSEFIFSDHVTNTGLVISPTLDIYQEDSLSIQLVIYSDYTERPVSFTCDVSTSIEHIISHTVCTVLDDSSSSLSMDSYVLKVFGVSEYFSAHSVLADYEYVHQCHKFVKPVILSLVDIKDLKRPLARTKLDDDRDIDFNVKDIVLPTKWAAVDHSSLCILVETLEKEITKMKEHALNSKSGDGLCPQGVVQAVKAICTILSNVETLEITDAVSSLIDICLLFQKTNASNGFDTLPELGLLQATAIADDKLLQRLFPLLELSLQKICQAVHHLLILYSKSFDVDFEVQCIKKTVSEKPVTDYLDTLIFLIGILHRLPASTLIPFANYCITCEMCYGKRVFATVCTKITSATKSFFTRLVIDEWLEFEGFSMCTLPRETILCFTVWGLEAPQEGNPPERTCIGWCGVHLFDYEDHLLQGCHILGLWSDDIPQDSGPLLSNPSKDATLLQINLPEFGCTIKFPNVVDSKLSSYQKRNFCDLDEATQMTMMEIIEKDVLVPLLPEEQELVWEKRNYLHKYPQVLSKILLSAHGWDWACLPEIYSLVKDWQALTPTDSLGLLLPGFPDRTIRDIAIKWMKHIVSDELCDYLPQMIQILRYEPRCDSPLAWFLLERSLTSIRVAHHMYWLLKQNISDPLVGPRMQLMLNSLLVVVGHTMRKRFESQETLLCNLSDMADKIKTTKESLRLSVLLHELEVTHHNLMEQNTCIPLSPSLEVCGVDVKSCSYFTSNTLPIKVTFLSSEKGAKAHEAIYKAGDDLRQDMITLQMIHIMDKLWLKDGLDLKIITFMCIATDFRKGMVELVPESETLRKIQTELGLTGSFKDRSISEWLQKYNTSELEYQQAIDNFTLSCAGYCVATYVLGICDRHNDNIMLKTSGHMFHIDFGKFLGDAQMLGSIKRDRTPFVLTSDMAYVINGGDKPSKRFQYFIDLCCQAFNIIRKHGGVFFNLFSSMVSSGVPGLNHAAVTYVRTALLPDLSEAEATAQFTRMIQESLKSWFTQFNFFIHNLAQLRFTGDHNDGLLLSFIPKIYTRESDGKITRASVIGYKKVYDPEKHYTYILNVERENERMSSYIFRTYREFLELRQKLCVKFALAKFTMLRGNPLLGWATARELTHRKKDELGIFLDCLFKMSEEIAHCDLVYTFFHPLLRDQEGISETKEKALSKRMRRGSSISETYGQVKFSLVYKNKSLFIMVMHAKNLNSPRGSAPDPYIKSYLLPDPNKLTKRKTQIIFKNCHPTFMEMLVYVLPYDVVRTRTLYVSVWNYDRVQENEFMGAVLIPLSEGDLNREVVQWYQLRGLNN